MPIAMPSTFKISVKAACPSHARTDATMRRHTLVIDEPSERGGTDVGPTPLETLLAAYLGCTNVILNLLAEEMGVILEGLTLALSASFDTRGVFDKAPVAVPFPEIALAVELTTDADEEQVERLRLALARRCPVSVILRQAGSRIVETWTVRRPR